MAQTTGPETPPRRTYRHEAFLYQGVAEYLEGTVPFLRAALSAGEPVMVATVRPRLDLLQGALSRHASAVRWVDMSRLGRNPACIIPAWLRFLEEWAGDGRAARGVGEPLWAGRRPEEIVECHLHEALLNQAISAETPLWLRCPYDVASLDAPDVDEARRNHPFVHAAGRQDSSPDYVTSGRTTAMAQEFPEPAERTEDIVFGLEDLASVRAIVTRRAGAAGMTPRRAADLELALHEIASNSLRHGGGTGVLRIWEDSRTLVCEVRDRGRLRDPLVGRRQPLENSEGGRGVWLANHLCDLVQMRSSEQGTTVRLLSWLSPDENETG